jgi:L-alanine-DL-glutamate epimerase-like enolase superfamily enzyme
MNIKLHPRELHLKHTFTISRESHDIQPTLIVELEKDGFSGFGEATSNSYYGVTVAGMSQKIQQAQAVLSALEWDTPETFEQHLQQIFPHDPFIRCALDIAANDWWAKQQRLPLYAAWGLTLHPQLPITNYTIGIDSIPTMIAKMKEMPYPLYKIKLGTKDDMAVVKALRLHTDATFRVDANCAWSVEQTISYTSALRDLGVEFVEQPLPAEQLQLMAEVYEQSALPLAADESCRVESDVISCAGKFHIINIKLVKCGGLTPARRMIAQAKTLGLKVMVGCMTESSVGISAIAHLLPLLDYVDMDGALLLSNDPATGVHIEQGKVFFADLPGTGAALIG